MTRFAVTVAVCAVACFGVGVLVSGDDYFDWGVAGGLFAVAVAGESFRVWLRRGRGAASKDSRRESSGI